MTFARFFVFCGVGRLRSIFFCGSKKYVEAGLAHFGAQSCPSWTGKSVGYSRHLLTDQMARPSDRFDGQATAIRSHGVNFCEAKRGFSLDPVGRRLFDSVKKEKALLFEKSNRNSLFSGCLWSKICSFWGSGIRARIAKRSPIARSSCDKLAEPF